MAKMLTNKQVIEMETAPNTTPSDKFLLNWCRNQYGMRVARAAAVLLLKGYSVAVFSIPERTGFTVDGDFKTSAEIQLLAGVWR